MGKGKIIDAVKSGKVLIADGAWGTALQSRGLKGGDCPELWNTEHPDRIYDVAASYIKAGSNIIGTNTFGGNRYKL